MIKPNIKALIFDWDQTLLDSWHVHRDAIWYAAATENLAVPSEQAIIDTFSGTLEEHLGALFDHPSRLLGQYVQYYRAHHLTDTRPFAGIEALVNGLKLSGFKLGLLSNKGRVMATAEMERWNLFNTFETAVFRDDFGVLKPEPVGLQAILREFNTAPSNAMYIGDSPIDVQVARRAGTYSGAALWGTLDKVSVLACLPDYSWHQVDQSLAFLLGLT